MRRTESPATQSFHTVWIVKDYVRSRRQSTREAFVPLHDPPGHAQVDFGEAVVEIVDPVLAAMVPLIRNWMRKAMVCEARGETERAIEYCERTIAWMDAHPEDFDPESREPFYEDIARLRASLRGAC